MFLKRVPSNMRKEDLFTMDFAQKFIPIGSWYQNQLRHGHFYYSTIRMGNVVRDPNNLLTHERYLHENEELVYKCLFDTDYSYLSIRQYYLSREKFGNFFHQKLSKNFGKIAKLSKNCCFKLS